MPFLLLIIVTLCVFLNLPTDNTIFRDEPTDIQSSGNLTRPLGSKDITFTCEGYVGKKENFPFSWIHVDTEGNISPASRLPNVKILDPVGR